MLKDQYNRPISNLRISVTPQCNLRCIYCHHEGEVSPGSLISKEDIQAVVEAGESFGIRSVKFTGGEPTIRPDLLDIIASVPESMESSLTTNGTLLADIAGKLHDAGLSRVNVSLDTLNHERYRQITGSDHLDDVLEGIEAAREAGLVPVKINMVVLEGINDDEIGDFLAYVRDHRDMVLQLIELMDRPGCQFHTDLTGIEEKIAQQSRQILTRRMHHRKKYCSEGAEVEVVRPLHNTEFCTHCNRLRVTSDGKLKPCLLRSNNHVDIKGKRGEELRECFHEAVRRRAPFFT